MQKGCGRRGSPRQRKSSPLMQFLVGSPAFGKVGIRLSVGLELRLGMKLGELCSQKHPCGRRAGRTKGRTGCLVSTLAGVEPAVPGGGPVVQ